MPIIDSLTKFVGINPNFPTAERKSAQNNASQEVVTMQDIADTVLSVSPTPPDPAPLAFANAATVGALSYSPTYNNGTSGVGATLTATVNGVLTDGSAIGKIDFSYTPIAGDVILVRNQSGGVSNGLYVITTVGSVSTPYVLTRFTDFDQSAELYPLQVNVIGGNSNAVKYFIQTTTNPTVGTSNLIFSLSNLQPPASQIAFIDTVIDTPLSNIVYADGTAFPTVPGSGATLTSTVNGALGTYYGLTANANSTIALGFTRVLLTNQTNPAYNGDYQVINAGSASTKWQLRRIQTSAGGFDRYTRYFVVSNAGSTKAGKIYFTKPNSPVLTNATIGTAAINIFEYGGSGLDIGTTPITSGTVGRILFQGTGNVAQQDSTLFWDNTNKRLGIGATPSTSVRLDVRAQGTLSTDIAFRVRNSADTADIAAVQGNGNVLFNNTTHGLLFNSQTLGNNQLELYSYGTTSVIINPVVSRFAFTGLTPVKGVVIGNSSTTPAALLDVWDFAGPGPGTTVARFGSQFNGTADNLNILFSSRYSGFTAGSAHLARLNIGQTGSGASSNARSYFKFELIRNNTLAERASITSQSNLLLQTPTEDTNDAGVIYIPNGTAPTGSITDGFKQYSANIIAGNAAPHFRTGNGDIIKLYKETTAVAASTLVSNLGVPLTDTDTFDGYTLKQVVKALKNLGILA